MTVMRMLIALTFLAVTGVPVHLASLEMGSHVGDNRALILVVSM